MEKIVILILTFSTLAFTKNIGNVIEKDTIISEDMIIEEGKTLTINPGVSIKFNGYYSIKVSGLIMFEGTAEKPILITALDRARGDSNWPGWKGFDIRGKNADALIRNCRIEGAYRNIIYNTRPIIDSCEFVGNHEAIRCVASAVPHIKNCTIYRNKYGIVVDNSTPMLLDNLITDNKIGVYTQLNASMIAGRNIIENNESDITADKSLGKNKNRTEIKQVWDIMRELY
jgi:parallel beta-helix repeat protein